MKYKTLLARYAPISLAPNTSSLSDNEREMLPILVEAAKEMDTPFWIQHFKAPDRISWPDNPDAKQLLHLNYGPWDRLNKNEPFLPGYQEMPKGLNCYPKDMTDDEFERSAKNHPDLKSSFTMVRRDEKGRLKAVPYNVFFDEWMQSASAKLIQASKLSANPMFSRFLKLRGNALTSNSYFESDMAWMDLNDNNLEVHIGPMETSMERRYWLKAAYAGNVMVKDKEWSKKLEKYIPMLGKIQEALPVPQEYKLEMPGLGTQLGVYDVIYMSGFDAQTIPIGVAWPDDEKVQTRKGIKAMQLRNLMKAKFEKLSLPVCRLMLTESNFGMLDFEAYFTFIMLHELGHGIGCKNTLSGNETVREALRENYYVIEECKADLLSLFLMMKLYEWGEINEGILLGGYISSLAKIFRNYGGQQDLIRLNYFLEKGAYVRDPESRKYQIDPNKFKEATVALLGKLLRIQGDGNSEEAQRIIGRYGVTEEDFSMDLEPIFEANMPLEIMIR